jgi:hypothetical protein
MTILYVLLIIVFSLAAYLFFAPFYIKIDSTENVYQFRFHRLVILDLKTGDEPVVELKTMGLKKRISLNAEGTQKGPHGNRTRKNNGQGREFPVKRIIRVLCSFQLTKCRVRLDSGDMQWNGILYPFFFWLGWHSNKDLQVNFTGENVVILEVKNSLARMSRAWFGSYK